MPRLPLALAAAALAGLSLGAAGCASGPRERQPAHGPIAVCPHPAPLAFVELSSPPAFLLPPPAPPPLLAQPAAVDGAARGLVTFHCRNADVREVVPELAQKLGRGIAVLSTFRGRLTFDLDGASPRLAIRTLAYHLRADAYALPGGTLVFERWGRGRFGAVNGQPVRSVLELLGNRAGAVHVIDEAVEGNWPGPIPGEDPALAIAEVCARSHLYAARYGSVIAVSPRLLVGGDPDLDTDRTWRDGLPAVPVAVDLREPGATSDALVEVARKAARVPVSSAPGAIRSVRATSVYGEAVPWTDLVSLVSRMEHAQVRRDGEGLLLETAGSNGTLYANAAPSDALLRLLAGAAGEHIVSAPRLRGSLTVPSTGAAPEDALRALAALEGLAVARVAPGLVALLPVGPRRLESLDPEFPPKRLPDGRAAAVRLEAVVGRGRRSPGAAALVNGRALGRDDEVPLEGLGLDAGCSMRLGEIDPVAGRCFVEYSSPSVPDAGLWLAVVPID